MCFGRIDTSQCSRATAAAQSQVACVIAAPEETEGAHVGEDQEAAAEKRRMKMLRMIKRKNEDERRSDTEQRVPREPWLAVHRGPQVWFRCVFGEGHVSMW